jgi:hypothetical protein
MKRMRIVAYIPQAIVHVKCSNSGAEQLQKLLEHIKATGNIGHTFDIIVDPNNKEFEEMFEWDGDGADSIGEITIEKLQEE